jgi:four helix bundle protein
MGDFKNLIVWQKAQALAVAIYRHTEAFPASERYALSSQIRRAAASVPANIAESRGRITPRDRGHFLHIAQGSARELESHILLARDLGIMDGAAAKEALSRTSEVQRLLCAFIYKKRPSPPTG